MKLLMLLFVTCCSVGRERLHTAAHHNLSVDVDEVADASVGDVLFSWT